MKKLESKISIASGQQKVWETMLSHGTYERWVAASWPNTHMKVSGKQDQK